MFCLTDMKLMFFFLQDVQVERWKNNSRNITGKRRIKASEKRKLKTDTCQNFTDVQLVKDIKMIKTLFHEKREQFQLPYYSCVTAKKSMPDMPMGAVYCIQCRTCITRVSKQKVRVLITFEVAFKKSGLISCKFHCHQNTICLPLFLVSCY